MKITTVLFDLDGTLLPMDQDVFVKAYFQGLCKRMLPYGYDADLLVKGIWTGTAAMVKNNGSCLNEAAFWNVFAGYLGDQIRQHIPEFDDFYRTDFQKVRNVCGFDPRAKEIIALVKELGFNPVLATNPLFPAVATHSRIRWAGLQPEDFTHVTTYENSTFCKPNPMYYQQILEHLGLTAEECVMVGNDATEDLAASQLGIPVFILTDCLINKDNIDLTPYPHGSFPELAEFLRSLPMKDQPISYAPAQQEDIPVIYSLCRQLINNYEDTAAIDYEKVLLWVRKKIESSIGCYTRVTLGDQTAGFFCLDSETGELDDLYILPPFRGQGLGTQVIRHCIRQSQKPLWLYVFRKNTRAIALYQRLGFSIVKDVGSTRCIMERK